MAFHEGDLVEYSAEAGLFEQCTVALPSTASVPPTPGHAATVLLRRNDGSAPFQALLSKVRPPAPPPPDDFVSHLAVGALVEATSSDGWARGRWLEPVPGSAAPLSVKLDADRMVTSVTTAHVRPALDWVDGEWRPTPDDPPAHLPPPADAPMPDAPPGDPPAPAPTPPVAPAPTPPAAAEAAVEPAAAPPAMNPPPAAPAASPPPFAPEVSAEVSKDPPSELPIPTPEEARELYTVGAPVEVTSFEDGLRGSWYRATVLAAPSASGVVKVRYAVNGASGPEEEEVAANRLRPLPPELSANEVKPLLGRDDELELYYSQGWWDVVVTDLKKSNLVVMAPEYDKKHTVQPKALRPRWTFDLTRRGPDPASEGWTLRVGGQAFTVAEWRERMAQEASAAAEVAAAEAAEAKESFQPLSAEAVAEAAAAAVGEAHAEAEEEAALDMAALDARVAHFRWGVAVEIRPLEDGYAGAWCPAEVLKALPDTRELLISLLDENRDTGGARETVRVARCRPAPPRLHPDAAAAWVEALAPGDALELWYDNAWWKVVLETRSPNSVVVKSPSYGSRHRAPLTHVRPRFSWSSPTRGWAYAQGQAQIELPVTDVLMAHQRPLPSHPQRDIEKRAAAATARVRTKAGGVRGGSRGRGGRGSKGRGGGASPAVPCPVSVGEILEVEVAEDEEHPGQVHWVPSEVREELPSGRFIACVNGDEDFLEEFGPQDEHTEWRKVEDQKAGKSAYAKAHKVAKEKAAATLAAEVAAAEEAARLQVEEEARAAAEAAGEAEADGGSEVGSEAPVKKRKVTASGAAPRPPPGVLAPHKFGFGMAVEVAGEDEGYEHSWYSAEVLKVAARLLVRYDSLFEEDSRRPLTESLDPARLRPVPPPPPEGWLAGVAPGHPMELQHDDGWWEVELVGVADGGEDVASASHLTVKGVDGLWDEAEIVVDPELLRPGWLWNGKAQSWGTRGDERGKAKPRAGPQGRGRGARPGRSGGRAG